MESELKPGQEVLIRARVVRRLRDERPLEQRGWEVETTRGWVYVEPEDIFCPLSEQKGGKL